MNILTLYGCNYKFIFCSSPSSCHSSTFSICNFILILQINLLITNFSPPSSILILLFAIPTCILLLLLTHTRSQGKEIKLMDIKV